MLVVNDVSVTTVTQHGHTTDIMLYTLHLLPRAYIRTHVHTLTNHDRNIAAMHEAAQHFVGEHDFRNVAKMDCANVTCFKR
jgi:tRNA U38,U39,U40 pseudouridine synthase TruA